MKRRPSLSLIRFEKALDTLNKIPTAHALEESGFNCID